MKAQNKDKIRISFMCLKNTQNEIESFVLCKGILSYKENGWKIYFSISQLRLQR